MFALLSSHCPLIPYAAGSAPRTTQFAPDLAHPVSGTDPVRTARSALASDLVRLRTDGLRRSGARRRRSRTSYRRAWR